MTIKRFGRTKRPAKIVEEPKVEIKEELVEVVKETIKKIKEVIEVPKKKNPLARYNSNGGRIIM